jgi:hypothetical protein
MMVGFYKAVKTRGLRIPLLTGYGSGVSVEHVSFQIDREALTVVYGIVPEDDDHPKYTQGSTGEQGLDELHAIREHRRLTRSVEWALPAGEGWDVQITTKASSEQLQQLPWTAHASRSNASRSSSTTSRQQDKVILNVKHAALPNDHTVLKVRVVIELSGPSSGWRLNGIPQPIQVIEERDPSYFMSQPILQDTTSMAELSFRSQSTKNTATTAGASSSSTIPEPPQIAKVPTERTAAAERSILSRVKRNYIYFSSLLQEPEAKWKRCKCSFYIMCLCWGWGLIAIQHPKVGEFPSLSLTLLIPLLSYTELKRHSWALGYGICMLLYLIQARELSGISYMKMLSSLRM